eukprot:1154840-Pelagomonas_calceolata.AAC.5
MAAQQRIKKLMHEHDLRNRSHALLWLFKVFGILAGMYACRVWGAKSTATNWPVLRERDQEPLCETLCQVLKLDLSLANRDESCWSAHVSAAFSGMHNENMFRQGMLSASKISMQEVDALSPWEMSRKAVADHPSLWSWLLLVMLNHRHCTFTVQEAAALGLALAERRWLGCSLQGMSRADTGSGPALPS